MNESQKTLTFWGIAAVSAAIAALFAWPSSSTTEGTDKDRFVNEELFPEFKDPLTAASLKIAVFDETLGELKNFEVRRDKDTGRWTIPSRGGYPADAIDQMRDAANLMVGLKALDAPTDNVEDHAGMGVVEPKLEDLDVGDEGVGRLVTFKDENQKELASLIIGDQVRDTENQIYVRKPGQDLVYAVQLDDAPLSTKFVDWIEEDLLQLSSIDLEEVEIKDYSVSVGLTGGVEYNRNYSANLAKVANRWELKSLKEYEANPLTPGKDVEVAADAKLNSQKLNELGNALDDLKFVNVLRKPEGISANLRADKDFTEDNEAASQLIGRGFLPVTLGQDGERELLSANGELTATTKEGVTYILRFGNVSGLGDKEESEEGEAGVNRYLMVSTVVDESRFPLPELTPIPQTLEDLDALDNPPPPPGAELPPELNPGLKEGEMELEAATEGDDKTPTEDSPSESEAPADEMKGDASAGETEEAAAETSEETAGEKVDDKTADDKTPEEKGESSGNKEPPKEESGDDKNSEEASSDNKEESSGEVEEPASEEATEGDPEPESGETEASGEGESSTVGGAQEAEPTESQEEGDEAAEETKPADAPTETPDEAKPAAESEGQANGDEEMVEETEEEKLERLAARQEKITKENERKLDERKDRIEAAKKRSRELNDRFA
ncbi:MAG: hypothetical protein AAFX06_13540, partial [Planctomycetota bacterium]